MEQNKRPNILWICTDQQRTETLGCYGNPFVRTPNIDSLATHGIRFTNAYAQSPVCMPSRASFLTGRYPNTCGVRYNGQDMRASEAEYLIPRRLRDDAGYTCGLCGKLHLGIGNPAVTPVMEHRINDGYDYFAWSHEPGYRWPTNGYSLWLSACGKSYKAPPRPDCKYVRQGMPAEYHHTKWCADRAIEFMESASHFDRPWLFSFNCYDPHHSFDPPPEYLERYLPILDQLPMPDYTVGELTCKSPIQTRNHYGAYGKKDYFVYDEMTERDHRMLRAAYYAMCDFIGVQVGRMLESLRKTGQLENTIVIFHSDHGESLGDHGVYLKGPYFYESGIRVPLIISRPDSFLEGVTCEALVELLDIAPTLLEACGLPPCPGMQGYSMLRLLTGEAPLDHFRDSVFSEIYADTPDAEPDTYSSMVFDGRYKLTKIHALPARYCEGAVHGELYDLNTDPTETKNLYDDPSMAEVRFRMLELLCDRMAHTRDPMPMHRYHKKQDFLSKATLM